MLNNLESEMIMERVDRIITFSRTKFTVHYLVPWIEGQCGFAVGVTVDGISHPVDLGRFDRRHLVF